MSSYVRTPMSINRQQTTALPDALRGPLGDAWEAFAHAVSEARLPLPRDPDFAASLLRVWACSDFACDVCVQHPELLYDLLDRGDLLSDYATGEYGRKLELALRGVDDEAGLGDVLRDFRTREMLRIAWRDLAGRANQILAAAADRVTLVVAGLPSKLKGRG